MRLYAATWSTSPDDCVQQALIKLALQTDTPDNPVTWLYRVVRNEAISQLRSSTRRRKRERKVAKPECLFDGPNLEIDSNELSRAVQILPEHLREVVVARIWAELSFEEIAELANCSSSAAHRRYQNGLKQLEETLTQSDQGNPHDNRPIRK